MRILFAGNIANIGYKNCKYFREIGVSADLLIESKPPKIRDPIKTDSDLNDKYPKWIRFYHKDKLSWRIEILKIMRDKNYDLIQSQYHLTIFSYLSKKVFIPQIVGSDLRELAFSNSIQGILMRRALKKAKIVLFTAPIDKQLLQKLNIHTGIFVPIMWDTNYFKPDISKLNSDSNLIIFHPSNQNWKVKGNDILIMGFAEFVKISPNSCLIIVDNGVDSEKTQKLIKKLGLENKIKHLEGPLNSKQMLEYYLSSDIIADQFIFPGVGGIACESLACGKPVLINCPDESYKNLHDEEPPIFHCKNSKDILKNLQILQDKKTRENIGLKSRDWVVKHHSPEVVISKLNSIYSMIIEGKSREEILKKIH